MKNTPIMLFVFLLASSTIYGQVKDISVTLSPAAEYTLWDDLAGLEDGVLLGGKVGFGFGEYVEIRATYMQSLDLKTNFKDFGLVNYSDDLFTARDVKLTRMGGEFKANFGTKTKLNPYFTLGTGVQSIQLESEDKQEQIFATAGLGAKFNLGKRAVFALEAKNTVYNFNAGSHLLTDADKTTFGVSDTDFKTERLSNWSAMASLQFYLGGRRPGSLTELDKAYLKSFKGLKLVLEPGLANIQFDSDSNFRDTRMLGGYLGLDFNDYIGLRGFYYQSTKDNQISTDFDELSMYGLEFRARLNDGNGVVPYLALGGGYINPTNNYTGKDGLPVNGSYFASGGLGLNIPLGKGFLAYGGIRALLTSDTNEADLQTPSQIQTHTMYNFGFKIALGKKGKSVSSVYNDRLSNALMEQQAVNDAKLTNLKTEYKDKITQLEADLKVANANNDVAKAVEILENKKVITEALKEVEAVEGVASKTKTTPQGEGVKKQLEQAPPAIIQKSEEKEPMVQMTPVEFELLIQRILREVEYNSLTPDNQTKVLSDDKDVQINQLNKRLENLEKLLLEINDTNLQKDLNDSKKLLEKAKNEDSSNQIIDKLEELNRNVERNTDNIEKRDLNDNPQVIIIKPTAVETEINQVEKPENSLPTEELVLETEEPVLETEEAKAFESKLTFQDASVFGGAMFGSSTSPVLGVRINFAINNTKILFVPELFFAFSNPISIGLSGNGILPINIENSILKPYVGAGLGFMSLDGNAKFNTNIILGTYANVLNGKLYVDFTTRNFLDYNQVSIGYKFKIKNSNN